MGRDRHPLFPVRAWAFALALLVTLAAAGCGSSDSGSTSGAGSTGGESTGASPPVGATTYSCIAPTHGVSGLRSTGVVCGDAATVAAAWTAQDGCALTANASRGACTVGRYRCLATAGDHGLAVSCSRAGHSVSFVARR